MALPELWGVAPARVEKNYAFEGSQGQVSLGGNFRRRQRPRAADLCHLARK